MRYKDYNDINPTPDEIKEIVDKKGDTFLMRDFIYFEITLSNDNEKNEKIKE
jgi:hypothetical protein